MLSFPGCYLTLAMHPVRGGVHDLRVDTPGEAR